MFEIMAASRSIMNSKPSAEISFTVLFSSSDISVSNFFLVFFFPLSLFALFCFKCKALIQPLLRSSQAKPRLQWNVLSTLAPAAAAGQGSLHTSNQSKHIHTRKSTAATAARSSLIYIYIYLQVKGKKKRERGNKSHSLLSYFFFSSLSPCSLSIEYRLQYILKKMKKKTIKMKNKGKRTTRTRGSTRQFHFIHIRILAKQSIASVTQTSQTFKPN